MMQIEFIGRLGTRLGAILLVGLLVACAGSAAKKPTAAEPETLLSLAENDDVRAALLASEFALQEGNGKQAAEMAARAATLSDDPKIAEHATRVAVGAKEIEIAKQSLARWKVLDKQSPGLQQAEAAVALVDADVDTGKRILLEILQEPGEASRRKVAQVILSISNKKVLGQVLRGLAESEQLPNQVDVSVMLSQIAQQANREALAFSLAETAVKKFPESAQPLVWRGHMRMKTGARAAANDDFEKVLKIDPNDREVRLTLSSLINDAEGPKAAAELLAKAKPDDMVLAARAAYAARADDQAQLEATYAAILKLDPPVSAERIELLAQLAELLKRHKEALSWYKKVQQGERWFNAQLRIAVLTDELGNAKKAIKQLESLRAGGLENDADLAETFLLEAEIQRRQDQDEKAIAAFARGLAVLPENTRLLYGRAMLFEQLNRIDECIADFRRVLEITPNDPDAMNALGYTLADRSDKYQEALELIDKALKLKPNDPPIMDSMGWVLYRLGRYEEALQFLGRAFALQADPEVAAHLGEVLWISGDKAKAKKIWQEGEKQDNDNAVLKATRKRLEK